jgi:hypothetical protein
MGLLPLLAASLGEDDRLFHADADQIWNKAHRYLYLQQPKLGIDNQEPLDPLRLGLASSRFLDKGASPKQAIELLDALLAGKKEPGQ